MPIPSLFVPNMRFKTTWTSDDNVQYRLYIIPSNADYSESCVDETLPSDFVLNDMKLETSIGELPAGMLSQVLKVSLNIASLQGSMSLDNLRRQLLQGTTTKKVPLNSNGSEYLADVNDPYHGSLTQTQRQFPVFNTFILQYNDSFGFAPNDWKTMFVGCQKYAAENELEISRPDNIVTYSVELYDVVRFIGEQITPTIWKVGLRCINESVTYYTGYNQNEKEEIRYFWLGENYFVGNEGFNLADTPEGKFWSYTSTFSRLTQKISVMYSAYLRAITRNLNSSFVGNDFFSKSIQFLSQYGDALNHSNLAYVAETWESTTDKGIRMVSGAHGDPVMFTQFTNFHEVYTRLVENSLEIVGMGYSTTFGSPDSYTITMTPRYPFDSTGVSTLEFDQDNTYSNLKIKLFSESLKYATVNVTSITGDKDTTEFFYGEEGTSGDNSKDVVVMFHNLPILTGRNNVRNQTEWWNGQKTYYRNAVNPGYVLYYEPTINNTTPRVASRVNSRVNIWFDADTVTTKDPYTLIPPPLPTNTPDKNLKAIFEQQFSGLPSTYCYALVKALGDKKQAEASLTSLFTECKFTEVGKRVVFDLDNYSTLLQSIYNSTTAKGVLMKHEHDIKTGTVELITRIDAEV